VIEVTDETGTKVEGALVSFRLPEDGVSGVFHNGLRTEILTTNRDGRVALRSLETGGLAGQFQIRMTVAKGAARSGAISTQFIAPAPVSHSLLHIIHPRGRMLEIGALVAAVAVAGYAKALAQRGGSIAQPPTIGPPTVVVGKP